MAKDYIFKDDVFKKYMNGEFGRNELMMYKSFLFGEIEDILESLIKSIAKVTSYSVEYLNELKQFIICRKKDFYRLGSPFIERFKYNFDEDELKETTYKFYHTKQQKDYITTYLKLYMNDSGGIGRFLQRCNLRDMYRSYKVID
jgi:hypothetical protein